MYDITKKLADIYINDKTKKPSVKNLQYYVGSWEQKIYMMEYKLQEEMLNKLFDKYQLNDTMNADNITKYDIVWLKCTMLDKCYSTNIKEGKSDMVSNILNPDNEFDKNVKAGNLDIITKIMRVRSTRYEYKNVISFASKYCSRHNPKAFPIYDKYVKQMLYYINKKYNFTDKINNDYWDKKDYVEFKNVLDDFIKYFFAEEQYDYKTIDMYLWGWAKEILYLSK